MSSNLWELTLERLRPQIDADEYRRWFLPSTYASDSGDQITVWVPTETDRRHLQTHYQEIVQRAFTALGRGDTLVRFVVAGVGDEDDIE
jgi:chromosomal replication initiation ATPase DnaA